MAWRWRDPVLRALKAADPRNPKHSSLHKALVETIESGLLKPGERFPTEKELAQALPVSVGTIQRAVRSLVEHGLVVRRRGAGSFVADPQKLLEQPLHCRFVGPGGFLPVYAKLVGRELIEEAGPWSKPLGQRGQNILRIDRKISIHREFTVLSRIYVDLLRFPLLLTCPLEDLAGTNIKLLLAKEYQVAISHIEQTLSLLPLPAHVRQVMGLATETEGARLDLLAVESSGKAALFQELYVPPNPYRLVVSDTFGGGEWAAPGVPARRISKTTNTG